MAENIAPRLKGVRLFLSLPSRVLAKLDQQCRWREYAADDKILDRDSEDRDVYIVVRGAVQVVNYSLSGRKVALARISAGSYFGELAAIDGQPRSASVVALEDCLVGTMQPRVFTELVSGDHPELATRLLQRLARIIRICDDRIMDLSTLGAFQRVYLELLGLAERDPAGSDSWVIWPMPAQKDIASQASTTRETVTRAISQLVADGIAERKEKSLYIRDKTRLETLAASLAPELTDDLAR